MAVCLRHPLQWLNALTPCWPVVALLLCAREQRGVAGLIELGFDLQRP
jgi:hypothetical protein